jgi:hypothetical protein
MLKSCAAKTIFAVCFLALWAATAFSTPVIYTGFDAGAGSLATSPNAISAAAAFDAAALNTYLVTFETGLPAGFSIDGGSILSANIYSQCGPALCGYNTTSGGEYVDIAFGGTIKYTFSTPIDAFGAYFTGWQITSQTITYVDNSTVTLDMGSADYSYGGTRFYGFVDSSAQISSITYDALWDMVAVDDIRYGSVVSTPEPASLLLLGAGFFPLALTIWRRKR